MFPTQKGHHCWEPKNFGLAIKDPPVSVPHRYTFSINVA